MAALRVTPIPRRYHKPICTTTQNRTVADRGWRVRPHVRAPRLCRLRRAVDRAAQKTIRSRDGLLPPVPLGASVYRTPHGTMHAIGRPTIDRIASRCCPILGAVPTTPNAGSVGNRAWIGAQAAEWQVDRRLVISPGTNALSLEADGRALPSASLQLRLRASHAGNSPDRSRSYAPGRNHVSGRNLPLGRQARRVMVPVAGWLENENGRFKRKSLKPPLGTSARKTISLLSSKIPCSLIRIPCSVAQGI